MLHSPQILLTSRKTAAAAVSAVTWDPANTDSSITLSGSNLIASITLADVNNHISRATSGVAASSKIYWEVLGNTVPGFSNALGLGFSDSTFTVPQNNFLGSGSTSLGYYGSGGAVFQGGSQVGTFAPYTSSDVIRFALDTTNSKIWVQVNSGGWNNDIIANQNPATNTGGLSITGTPTLYPAVVYRVDNLDTLQVTGRFASTDWGFSAPSGFTHL